MLSGYRKRRSSKMPIHIANSFTLTRRSVGEIIRALSSKPLPIAAAFRAAGPLLQSSSQHPLEFRFEESF